MVGRTRGSLVCWRDGDRKRLVVCGELGVVLLHLYAWARFQKGVDTGKRAVESGRKSIIVEVLREI